MKREIEVNCHFCSSEDLMFNGEIDDNINIYIYAWTAVRQHFLA